MEGAGVAVASKDQAEGMRWHLERGFPATIPVGAGTAHIVSGWCFHPSKQLRSLSFSVGETQHLVRHIHELRLDVAAAFAAADADGTSLLSGFYGLVPLVPALAGRSLPIAMRVEWTDGSVDVQPIGTTTFRARPEVDPAEPRTVRPPTLVICLATYNPKPRDLARQVDSIIGQTFADWVCVVNDDHSAPEAYAQIESICARDRRFLLARNASNLGFYRNYERALWRAREVGARFVALADQDDYWYPQKLARSLDALDPDSQLIYCDMKIVEPSGTVMSNTYWFDRRNNHTDADVVFLANTVTGAASVFHAALLDQILPFPDPIGDCFHDHWIACCALAGGRMAYLDEPLYEYIQHESNVIGHCAFDKRSWLGSAGDAWRGWRSGRPVKDLLRGAVFQAIAVYTYEYRRLELFARILGLRFGKMPPQKARAFRLADGSWMSVVRLIAAHGRYRFTGATTGDAEMRLARGFVVTKAMGRTVHVLRRRVIRRIRRARELQALYERSGGRTPAPSA